MVMDANMQGNLREKFVGHFLLVPVSAVTERIAIEPDLLGYCFG